MGRKDQGYVQNVDPTEGVNFGVEDGQGVIQMREVFVQQLLGLVEGGLQDL